MSATDGRTHHLVSLTSVEDDGFGDDLDVIWEVEPDSEVLPKATLPTPDASGFDDPGRLQAFLHAIRWGAIASADPRALQAPFRAGISIEDYQLDPVVRALRMPRVNLLIADDVGLGKTIEAGLVVQELLLRHRARTVLVVCPSSLCIKWQAEMRDRFGLDFRVVDAAAIKALRRDRGVGANVWTHYPRLIVSIDWIKGARAMSLLDDILPHDVTGGPRRFDLLVVDEVHQCAPAGRGAYATDSLRTLAIRKLAPHCEHRLFLSATPHNGYTESFAALLEMLDSQRFTRRVLPPESARARVVIRRLKSELREALPPREDGTPRFAERRLVPIEVEYPDSERAVHADLVAYTASRRRAASSSANHTAIDFVTLLLKKRLFSSPAAFHQTLQEHLRTLNTRGAARGVTDAQLRARFERLDDDVDEDDALDEATADALSLAARAQAAPLTQHEQDILDRMRAWAESERFRADAKATELIDFLEQTCRPLGAWNDERVIVFTEYRDTQRWLFDLLAARGMATRIALLYGGMDADAREQIKAEFQAPPTRTPVRILLATDAASEGIDLQLHCHRMVHVEIPFSPSRLEQRNGRIDRHGQPSASVEIHHFVGKGYRDATPGSIEADLEFLTRIARKVETIRDDLGTAGPVLARQVEEAMLGRRSAIDESAVAHAQRSAARDALRLERNLRQEIAKLRERIDESIQELQVTPATVQQVVATALALARQPALKPAASPGCFVVPALSNAWATATIGLEDPISKQARPITFDQRIAAGNQDVVLAHLGHRLVAQSTTLLRAEIWKTTGERALHRITACVVPDAKANKGLDELTLVGHARLVITGADGHRLHEEIITAGGRVRNARFARLNVGETRDALAAATTVPVDQATWAGIVRQWAEIEDALSRSLDVRGDEVSSGLEKMLRARADEDIANIEQVLTDLKATIAAEIGRLRGSHGEQLRLQFTSDEEREQLDRDLDALERRIHEIPAEIAREQAAIRRRYAEPSVRVFPAAVTCLVPARLTRGAR